MTSLSERTLGLAARMVEHPRETVEAALIMIDGAEIRGMLHRAHGTRTLDFLNRQAEGFVAMTDATVTRAGRTDRVPFIAINKAHVVQVVESSTYAD